MIRTMTDKERLTCLQVLPPGCAVGDYVQIDAGISSRDLLRLAQSYDGEIRGMVTRPGNGKCMYGRVEGTAFNNGSTRDAGNSGRDLLKLAQSYDEQISGW